MFPFFSELPLAWGEPCATGALRTTPGDFRVTEELGFVPNEGGEHVWLWITRAMCNTHDIALKLADLADVEVREIGYAGMKDRNAISSQWFSVAIPAAREPDWLSLETDALSIGQVGRHSRKLKRGSHKGNRFELRVRDILADRARMEERLEWIVGEGVPNYFGPQRFGRGDSNIDAARRLFLGTLRVRNRFKRGIYLSAARSALFNTVLAGRVETGSWNSYLEGDAMMLNGKRSFFMVEKWDELLESRLLEKDIHPSGPLWGTGQVVRGAASGVEEDLLAGMNLFRGGLEQHGMRHERRALRMCPAGIEWSFDDDTLEVSFSLQKGEFATSLVRELIDPRDSI